MAAGRQTSGGLLGVTHELHVYPGADQDDVPSGPVVLQRVRAWHTRHGLF